MLIENNNDENTCERLDSVAKDGGSNIVQDALDELMEEQRFADILGLSTLLLSAANDDECLSRDDIVQFVCGDRIEPDWTVIEDHLSRCSDCRSRVKFARKTERCELK